MLAAAWWALAGCADDDGSASTAPQVETDESVVPGSPVGFDLGEVSVTTTDGGHRTISVWVADSTDERGRGLMDVTDLGEAEGMLFVFDSEGVARFYMWQTPMPLDIAFLDADGRFVDSAEMEPCLEPSSASCARYAPDEPFLMALEVPAGELDDLGIGPGARITRS